MTPEFVDSSDVASGEASGEANSFAKALPPRPTRTRSKRRWTMQHPPEEVNRVLRDYDSGMNAAAIGQKHGVSKATLYRWITQFEDKRDVDDDPGSMRLRIATLEKIVLHLNTELAQARGVASVAS